MNANELIVRAQELCRHRRIRFPSDLMQYAHQWHRERFDLELCWRRVKPLLSSGRPLWQAEVDIRRHHDRVQRERNAKDLKAGEPLVASPTPDADSHWDSERHQQAVPPPASACGTPDDPDGLSAERHPAPRGDLLRPPPNFCGDFFDPVSEFGLKAYFLTRSFGAPYVRERVRSSVLLTVDENLREQRPQFP
jgi:hypothetical protein